MTAPTSPTPIEDYALIGDRRTAALVSRAGSIDWLCVPRFDSPSCFAALLGGQGHWLIGPVGPATSTRRYLDGSLVLETTHETQTGVVRVIDVMPATDRRTDVIRRIEGVRGTVRLRHEFVVRFSYGRVVPWVRRVPHASEHGCGTALQAVAGPDLLLLRGPQLPRAHDHRHVDELTVTAGDVLRFDLTWAPSYAPVPQAVDPDPLVADIVAAGRRWLAACTYAGPYAEAVHSSMLTLQAMTHQETGGIIAAPTTSLPEDFGGERNWDYRFTWLRDASLTVGALVDTGMTATVASWRGWLLRAIAGEPADLQIMYTVDGGRDLLERTLDHLPGYGGARPVRIGNGAAAQQQSDVVGEVMIALEKLRDAKVLQSDNTWALQRSLVDELAGRWREPDNGLWEIRGPKRHFTHSRAHVWAAFDRAVRACEEHGLPGPVERWRALRDGVRAEIFERGFNARVGWFTQHYDTTEVDASLLRLPVIGFLPADDPRMIATVERIEHDLLRDGLVLRYRTQSGVDGLSGDEHPFLACSFWLVMVYALQGRSDDAHALMRRLLALRNDVGLLSEEYDPIGRRQVGNFPQAFSHLGLIDAAVALQCADAAASPRQTLAQPPHPPPS